MKEIVIFMLIAFSDGAYNRGTAVRIADFQTMESCQEVASQIGSESWSSNTKTKCIKASVLIKE